MASVRRRAFRFGTALAVVLLVAGGGAGAWAAFIATSQNPGNSIASGSVSLTDNDAGAALLGLSSAQPGASDVGCIKVSYDGSLPSGVRLYGTTTGTGLEPYLDMKVTRGSYSPSEPGYDSCTNFQPDATDYIGGGPGVVYQGTLQGYGDDYATGLVDPRPSTPESWGSGESHVYKVEVTLQSDLAAQSKTATQTFTWEARNE